MVIADTKRFAQRMQGNFSFLTTFRLINSFTDIPFKQFFYWVSLLKAEICRSFITTTIREQRPRSHHKGATGRIRPGDQRYPILCHCQLGQDIPI